MEINEEEKKTYIPVYDFVSSKLKLKGLTEKVYCLIYSYNINTKEYCYPSITTISKRLGVSRKAVWEALEELRVKNLIVGDNKTQWGTYKYRITPLEDITEEMINRRYIRKRKNEACKIPF
mgnify:CR=1 FL=1